MRRAKSIAPMDDQGDLLETERKPRALAKSGQHHDPESLIALAITSGDPTAAAAVVEKLTRLRIELEERADRKELFAAIAKAKREFPKFEKDQHVEIVNAQGQKSHGFDYAPLDKMLPGAEPVLEANSLFVTWGQQSTAPGMVRLTCTVTHANGQCHSASFDVTTESRAGMSPQQKFSASATFGMRMSFMLLFGIVPSLPEAIVREYDNTPVNEEQVANLKALREEAKMDGKRLLAHFGIARIEDLPARQYGEAVKIMEDVRRGTYRKP